MKIPFAPLPPPSQAVRPPAKEEFKIPTFAERRELSARRGNPYGGGKLVASDWSAVNLDGDLLYIGCAARSLNTRLHPTSHAMWSLNHRRAAFRRVRIAIWSVPPEFCTSVEVWLTRVCAPLWSGATGGLPEWEWRDPDAVLPPADFHPRLRGDRGAPFGHRASGVYAWLLASAKESSGWVRTVMLDGFLDRRERRLKASTKKTHICPVCDAAAPQNQSTNGCKSCGRSAEEVVAASGKAMEAALAKLYEEK